MGEAVKTGITGIPTVGVPVTDQDRALDFYVGTLGFEKLMDAPLEQIGGRWIMVAPVGSATSIALIPSRQGLPAGIETGIRFATEDASVLHRELQERGVDVGELLLWEGVPPMFSFRDPDGNGMEIVQ